MSPLLRSHQSTIFDFFCCYISTLEYFLAVRLRNIIEVGNFLKAKDVNFSRKKGCLTFPLHFLPRYKVQTLPVLVTLLIDVHVFLFQVFLLKIGRKLNTLNMRKLLNSKVFLSLHIGSTFYIV